MDLFHQVQGTIFPAPIFDPMMDAQMLGGALQGFGKHDNFYNLLLQIFFTLPCFKIVIWV